jgi:hypothetical protein
LSFGGAVAQLGARLDGIEEVEGSNPFGSTISDPAGAHPVPDPGVVAANLTRPVTI